MTISRGQMNRQIYGLGSLVKKITGGAKKAVKKVAGGIGDILSSDLGKAALLGFSAYKLGPMIGSKLGTMSVPKFLTGTTAKTLAAGAAGALFGGAFAAKSEEEVAEMKSALTERVDSYLEYVADEWFTENMISIEKGLKIDMTESFLSGMKDLFEAHYVEIPEDKYDVLHSMTNKLDEMESKLNEQIEKNVSLNARLSESVADGIVDQVSEGLAQTQKEKLASLAESVEFESETQYREKLETLKEAYFAPKKQSTATTTETLSEGVSNDHQQYSGSMSAYVRALGSTVK